MVVGEFNGRRLYTGLKLDYRLGLWAPTSASRAIFAVAELLVVLAMNVCPRQGEKLCDVNRLGLSSYCRVQYMYVQYVRTIRP